MKYPAFDDALAAASYLCNLANTNVLHIEETYLWSHASSLYGLVLSDFVNDQQELRTLYGDEAIDVYGLYNWKYLGGER